MKLHEIRKKYQLNQNTFYGWLRETGIIEKTTRGYVVGEKALDGMMTLETKRVDANGELQLNTQVTMDENHVSKLVDLYEKSGLPKLYSGKRTEFDSEQLSILTTELNRAIDRISVLENQVLILTKQLALYAK